MKAATHRLIAYLQPNLLCIIVVEKSLKALFDKLKKYTTIGEVEFVKKKGVDTWFENSHKIFNLFKGVLQYEDPEVIAMYPWQILRHLENLGNIEKEAKELLENNHNLILTGAPGTGKTYLAMQIAKAMNAEWDFVQFHPSYDYSDFVEGLRSIKDSNGNIGFERMDGVFKSFCKKAIKAGKTSVSTIETRNLQMHFGIFTIASLLILKAKKLLHTQIARVKSYL